MPQPEEEDAKAIFRSRMEPPVIKDIPVARLREQVETLAQDVSLIAAGATSAKEGDLRLTEISVQVEITASGGIALIGTANVGAKASMTLTFAR
jgi:hypothetical protein